MEIWPTSQKFVESSFLWDGLTLEKIVENSLHWDEPTLEPWKEQQQEHL